MCIPEIKDKKTLQAAANATATSAADAAKLLALPEVEVAQVSKMNAETPKDVILTFEGVVYKVPRSWIERHPGGAQAIYSVAGQDASVFIRTFHNPQTVQRIKKMMKKLGRLPDSSSTTAAATAAKKAKTADQKRLEEMNADFEKVHQLCLKNGWYEGNLSIYFWDYIRTFALFAGAVSCLVYSHELAANQYVASCLSQTGVIVLGSILMGLYFQQIAFFGHDTGHNAMCGDHNKDFWTGIFFGPLASGIGISWWKSTHNTHHIVPNAMEDDPNIQHVPLFCFEEKMAENWWSNYHNRPVVMNQVGKFLIRYQHWYYFPIMAVARFLLYGHSLKHVIELCPLLQSSQKNKELRKGKNQEEQASWKPVLSWNAWVIEAAALLSFYVWFGSLTYATGFDAPLFLIVSTFTSGILHVQINLSHVIMDFCVENPVAELSADDYGFYDWQALTTLDVNCPSWMHWFHGGLEYQIEHHVFPRVHRKHLPKLAPFMDSIYAKHGIETVRLGFLEANWILMKHMARVGAYVADKWDPEVAARKAGDTTRTILTTEGARGIRWT